MRKQVLLLLLCLSFITSACTEEIFENLPPIPQNNYVFTSPTQRYLRACGWETISSRLKSMGVSMTHRNLCDRIWQREQPGFIGYHGSTQTYRVFQDIITFLIREKLQIPVRKDFHFLRVPADPQFHYECLEEYGDVMGNYKPSLFFCLNFALYGNYEHTGSCSYYYFATNRSHLPIQYETILADLFEKLGADSAEIPKGFAIGEKHLGSQNGVLFQLFDMSHWNPWRNYYELADTHCDTLSQTPLSEMYTQSQPVKFRFHIYLLMSNRHTLNPYSPLVIKRYDTTPLETTKQYEKELQSWVKNLIIDPDKAKQYKKELLTSWGVE